MPDQNNTNQTQDQSVTTTAAPPVPPTTDQTTPTATQMPDFQTEVTDVPPMPQDNTQTTTPAEDAGSVGSAAPSDLPDISTSTPKKKFGGGKVIATILGVLLLVGGVGTGIYLTRQNQDIREEAGSCIDVDCAITIDVKGDYHYNRERDQDKEENLDGVPNKAGEPDDPTSPLDGMSDLEYFNLVLVPSAGGAGGIGSEGASCTGDSSCANGYTCVGGTCQGNPITNTCGRDTDPGAPVCCTSSTCDGETVCEAGSRLECKSAGGIHCTIDANSSSCEGANPPDEEGGPTPTPGPTASCQNIKAYSSTWSLLTPSQLSALEVGDQVNFCVLGVASAGTFDMARFTINGSLKPNTTTVRPGTTDFCQNFTIPAATTAFNVSAEIHHATLGWK